MVSVADSTALSRKRARRNGDRPITPALRKLRQRSSGFSSVRGRRLRTTALYEPDPENLEEALARWRYLLRPDMPLIRCFSGVRGGGKSLSASWAMLVDFLIRGRRVWSNIPVGAEVSYKGESKLLTTEPFDSEMVFKFDEDLRQGAVFIDEANYWVDSRRSASTKNILFADIAQQIRKRELDLCFTVQFENWLESRLRQMMDVVIKCNDLHLSEWGDEENIDKGIQFLWRVQDWSGALSGQAYHETGQEQHYVLSGKGIWPIYNSRGIVDIWEARRGVQVEQDKMHVRIGMGVDDKIEAAKAKYGDIGGQLLAIVNSGRKWINGEELYAQFGVSESRSERNRFGSLLRNFGVRTVPRYSRTGYDLSDIAIDNRSYDEK